MNKRVRLQLGVYTQAAHVTPPTPPPGLIPSFSSLLFFPFLFLNIYTHINVHHRYSYGLGISMASVNSKAWSWQDVRRRRNNSAC